MERINYRLSNKTQSTTVQSLSCGDYSLVDIGMDNRFSVLTFYYCLFNAMHSIRQNTKSLDVSYVRCPATVDKIVT